MIIWIASYPRSGNTLVRIILKHVFDINTCSIYNDIFDIGDNKNLSQIVGHVKLPDDFDLDESRNSDEIYFIKTHEYPENNDDKAIYIVRDGRESTISFWKYLNTYHDQNYRLIDIIYGNNFVGSWGDHVAAWSPYKRQNTLYVKYEDILDDPNNFYSNLSKFINKDQTGKEIPNFDELKSSHPQFFRSGKKSSWKDIMTENEKNIFWLKNYIQMTEYEYTDDMPSLFTRDEDTTRFMNLLSQEYSYLQKNIITNKNEIIEQLNNQIRTIRENNEARMGELREELNTIIHNRMFKILDLIFRIRKK